MVESEIVSIARICIAGNRTAIETCWLLASHQWKDPELLNEEDRVFITVIVSETDALPVGNLKENWHPDFVQSKLDRLAKYDAVVMDETKAICQRILETMELRRMEKKSA